MQMKKKPKTSIFVGNREPLSSGKVGTFKIGISQLCLVSGIFWRWVSQQWYFPQFQVECKEAVHLKARDLDVQFSSQLKHHVFVDNVNLAKPAGINAPVHQHYCSCPSATLTQPTRIQLICCVVIKGCQKNDKLPMLGGKLNQKDWIKLHPT